MPTNIADVDSWSDPVIGPAGGDQRNSASVLQGLQHLANRTRYLLNEHIITPPAMTGSIDSLDPVGWSDATVVMLSTDFGVTFAGASSAVRQTKKLIVNTSSLPIFLLANQATSGAPLICPSGSAVYTLSSGDACFIMFVSGSWRVIGVAPQGFVTSPQLRGTINELVYANADGSATAPRARTVMLPLESPGVTSESGWQFDGLFGGDLSTQRADATYHRALELPHAATLTRVRALVHHGSAVGTMSMAVSQAIANKVTPYGNSTIVQLGSTSNFNPSGFGLLDTGAFSHVIDNAVSSYRINIRASSGAQPSPPASDLIKWIEVTFLDPGPRNY